VYFIKEDDADDGDEANTNGIRKQTRTKEEVGDTYIKPKLNNPISKTFCRLGNLIPQILGSGTAKIR